MEIEEIQKQAIEAINKRLSVKNIPLTKELLFLHLQEEVGELTTQLNNELIKRRPVDVHNIGEEISDCILLLTAIAKEYNIDLNKAIPEKIQEVKSKKN
jgi:NTP pyrophosphatase (non-canonical NTP hydrolase)